MEVALPTESKLKITPKKSGKYWVSQWEKNKLKSNSPREYDDEFLNAFKEQFEFKKYPTTMDLSKLIQRATNTEFMFKINYLMLFANCMIHCDNSSRLKYYVIKNIKSSYIISDFDWCSFIWDHIQTSKIGWDDLTMKNCYYRPNAVLMLIYLHYTKFDDMATMPRKWLGIRKWTNQDAIDRETLEMHKRKFGLVEVIQENDKESKNETKVEKQKFKELIYETIREKFKSIFKKKRVLEDLLKENMKMHELFYEDEKLELFVKRFKEEFTTGLNTDKKNRQEQVVLDMVSRLDKAEARDVMEN
nr:200 kDa antigen p200 [Tanacetum cinerariifolium]